MNETALNPCLTCGYCCAFYRISFYWAETESQYFVPIQHTEPLDDFRRCMRGTNQPSPRCVALQGNMGQSIYCSVYPNRPGPCRDFPFSGENGIFNPRCEKIRLMHRLPLLMPDQIAEALAEIQVRAVTDSDLELLILFSYMRDVHLSRSTIDSIQDHSEVIFLRLDATDNNLIAEHFQLAANERMIVIRQGKRLG